MTPESKTLLNRFAQALSNETIYAESETATMKCCREYSAKTEAARNVLVEHIEKLEDSAPVLAAAGVMQPVDERALDLYDEIKCDLCALFGRASLEGHEVGQELARKVKSKMQQARAALSAGPTQAAPFGMFIERTDGTTDFRRTGEPFPPTALSYKVWMLYDQPAAPAAEQTATTASASIDVRMLVANIPLPDGPKQWQHGFVSAKEAILNALPSRAQAPSQDAPAAQAVERALPDDERLSLIAYTANSMASTLQRAAATAKDRNEKFLADMLDTLYVMAIVIARKAGAAPAGTEPTQAVRDVLADDAGRYQWAKAQSPDLLCAIAYRYPAACDYDTPDEAIDAARGAK